MGLFGLDKAQSTPAMGTGPSWLLEPGAYVATILRMETGVTREGKKKLVMTWDVAEGPKARTFASSQYPPQEHLGLEGNALGFTKWKLERISASNSGGAVTFDAVACADSGNFQHFIGKVVGLLVGVEVVTSRKDGSDREQNFVERWLTAQEARQGFTVDEDGTQRPIVPPARRDSRKKGATAPTPAAAPSAAPVFGDEIPF